MILNWTVDLEQPSVSMFFKMVSRGLDPTTAKGPDQEIIDGDVTSSLQMTIRSKNTNGGSRVQSRLQVLHVLGIMRQIIREKLVVQWPGLMVEEFIVLSENRGDYQRVVGKGADLNGTLLVGTMWKKPDGEQSVCLNFQDLQSFASSDATIQFSIEDLNLVGSLGLSHVLLGR